jgi:basic membrane protein A
MEECNMKKFLALALALVMVFALVACGQTQQPQQQTQQTETTSMKVAMITDYGDITDQSFNQTTYEAAKGWSEANGADFTYFKPASDSDEDRVSMIENAIDQGYTVLIMPGYAFAKAIVNTVEKYPDVTFIALDVSEYDLQDAHGTADDFSWKYPANLYSAVYQEELCGYMAGYAAVKLGYTKLGFLGGMAVPAVVRYGYGFVQGANAAAEADGKTDVTINYAYGNQFYGDADITAAMDTWYGAGTEIVFACGGGIYSSAAEAAAKVNGKVIGVDVDQKGIIDGQYGEGMTVTSAMKGLAATVNTMLTKVKEGKFEGGKVENLGLVSEDPELNYVQIPLTTQFADNFTEADYRALVADMFSGKITVDNDIAKTANDFATAVALTDLGNLK